MGHRLPMMQEGGLEYLRYFDPSRAD